MRRVRVLVPAVVLALILGGSLHIPRAAAGLPAPGSSGPCPNPSGAYSNIVVSSGQECFLQGATVTGNITVLPGGELDASSSSIAGNIAETQPAGTNLQSITVGGNITVQGMTAGSTGILVLKSSRITGNVSLSNNDTGGNRITQNTITGMLVCLGNTPLPIALGNTAARFVGQCTA